MSAISCSFASCCAVEPANFLLELHDPLLQLRFLAQAGRAAQFEQLALIGDRVGDRRIAGAGKQFRRERDGLGAVSFGFEPRLARREFVEALGDDGEIGAGDGIVELYEHIACLDAVAVLHVELADDAAGRVLHFLHVGIDDDGAFGDERAGNLGRRRPAADAAGEQQHNQSAGHHMAMNGFARTSGGAAGRNRSTHATKRSLMFETPRHFHAPALPLSGTTLSGRGMARGR